MSSYHKYDFLWRTCIEADSQLTDLTKWIGSRKYLELGDDPQLTQSIEEVLRKVQSKVKSLEPYFDLAETPMSEANIYFALTMHVGETLKFLEEVEDRDYGSQQNTRDLLERLKLCINSVNDIGGLVMIDSDILQ